MKEIIWKFYFWALLTADMISFIVPLNRRIWEMLEMCFFLIAIAGLFGYCWKKQIFARIFWQIFFTVFLCWIIFYYFFLPHMPLGPGLEKTPFTVFFGIAALVIGLHLPLIAALFLYAFKRKDIWGY
jgi:hypothetical protein